MSTNDIVPLLFLHLTSTYQFLFCNSLPYFIKRRALNLHFYSSVLLKGYNYAYRPPQNNQICSKCKESEILANDQVYTAVKV